MNKPNTLEINEHICTDFDWFNPDINSDNDMDEVLACTECGRIKWTARELEKREENDTKN